MASRDAVPSSKISSAATFVRNKDETTDFSSGTGVAPMSWTSAGLAGAGVPLEPRQPHGGPKGTPPVRQDLGALLPPVKAYPVSPGQGVPLQSVHGTLSLDGKQLTAEGRTYSSTPSGVFIADGLAGGAGELAGSGPSRAQLTLELSGGAHAAQLRQQAQQHAGQLRARLGTVSASACIAMARDNPLAEHNAHGWALAFLNAGQGPTRNAQLLDSYIGHLSHWLARASLGSAAVDQPTSNRLQQCLDLSCHYLVKTGWFEQAPTQVLAYIANGLSKQDGHACKAALSWMASIMTGERIQETWAKPLGMLASAFAKNPKAPEVGRAMARIARRLHADTGLLRTLDAKGVSIFLNALSKWPGNGDCRQAANALAVRVAQEPWLRNAMDEYGIPNSLNALSKWPRDRDCARAVKALAERVHSDSRLRKAMNEQALGNSLNALSKWPGDSDCAQAAKTLAARVHREPAVRNAMTERTVANSLNAVSKWSSDRDCAKAAKELAACLHLNPELRNAMVEQGAANSLNALSKWPGDDDCAQAAKELAARVRREPRLRNAMNEQEVANSLNGLSKWPGDDDCAQAAKELAARVHREPRLRNAMNEQEVSNSLNALSKWPDDPDCAQAAKTLAACVHGQADLRNAMDDQQVANSLNALSKWSDDADCARAATALAGRVHGEPALRNAMNTQAVASSLNAVSKWADDPDCAQAAMALARRVHEQADLRNAMEGWEVANALNALSKWPHDDDCCEAALGMARGLGRGRLAWSRLAEPALAQVANAVARLGRAAEDAGDAQARALLENRLRALADHMDYSGRFGQADAQNVAMILKALGSLRLHEDLDMLGGPALQRLGELYERDAFRTQSLETVGHVCAALLPLARSPKHKRHREPALRLLERMHEAVHRKADAFLRAQAGQPPELQPGEQWETRRPGLSLYLVLKTYQVVGGMYKRSNLGDRLIRTGSPEDLALRQRRDELEAWTRHMLERADAAIKSDLGSDSWNMIMQIESDFALDALDDYLFEHTGEVVGEQPPAQFDLKRVIDSMRHEPRPPSGDVGISSAPVLDMQGRKVRDGDKQYSVLAHLTEGKVLQAWVELPGPPSDFMLSRLINYNGEKLRADLALGSKLKAEPITLESIFSQDPQVPKGARTPRKQGQLLAVRYADTVPGSAFSQLMRKLLGPFEEAAAYIQRALMPSPPSGVEGLAPHDHVLEGQFRVHQFRDRPGGKGHPLTLRDEHGRPIRIALHDGVMLVREDMALRMPVFAKASAQNKPGYGEKAGVANVPPQALQHYGRGSDALVQETVHKLREQLQSDPPDTNRRSTEQRQLAFRRLTTGQITGKAAITIPSADDKLYLPRTKSSHIKNLDAGVLVGRSPYDKPNLRSFTADRMQTSADDPTVKFLERCKSMQFSFVALEAPTEAGAEPQLRFDKGVAVLVPEQWWPKEHADCQMLATWENNKTRTDPTPKEDRVDGVRDCVGILQCTEVFMEGSLYAMPIKEQERGDGDNDGDAGTVSGDRPELFAHIHVQEEQERQNPHVSLKPEKTKTQAEDEQGRYRVGRGKLVLNARKLQLEETYTTLKMRFEALAPDLKQAVSEQALFGSYEGTEPQLERDIRSLLDGDELDARSLEPVIARAQQNVLHADYPVARVVAELLVEQLQALQAELRGDTAAPRQDDLRLRDVILERGLQRLFPELAEALGQADDARERLQALLDKYPQRMEPPPDGHVRGDALASMRNFLTLGIKIGTDKKTRAAVSDFARRQSRLNKIMDTLAPGNRLVDYGKGTARRLNAGTYDHEEAKQRLADNPTLAAQLMAAAGDELLRHDPTLLTSAAHPQQTASLPATADPQARAGELHEQARQHEPAITQHVLQVAQSCAAQRRDADRTLRSPQSLRDELAGARERAGGPWKAPNALRYTLQLPPERFTEDFKQAMQRFEELGYARVQVNNSFAMRDPLFMGVAVVLEGEDGFRFALQFHAPDSHRVKTATHDVHKQLQAERLKAEPDTARIEQLQQTLRRACESVPLPPGVEAIRSWRVDPQEGLRMRRQARQQQSQAPGVASPARQAHALARQKEQTITPVMNAVAQAAGAQLRGNVKYHAGDRRIEDQQVDAFLKSVDSIKSALKRARDSSERELRVDDALRYTLVFERAGFTGGVDRAFQALRQAGMELVHASDFFASPGAGGYRGLNTTWRDAEGYEYSVQCHTQESFGAKAQAHLLYKRAQADQERLRKEEAKEQPNAAKLQKLQDSIDQCLRGSEECFSAAGR